MSHVGEYFIEMQSSDKRWHTCWEYLFFQTEDAAIEYFDQHGGVETFAKAHGMTYVTLRRSGFTGLPGAEGPWYCKILYGERRS